MLFNKSWGFTNTHLSSFFCISNPRVFGFGFLSTLQTIQWQYLMNRLKYLMICRVAKNEWSIKSLNFWFLFFIPSYSLNASFTKTNSSWLMYESVKVLEIKASMLFNLFFSNSSILSWFFFFSLTYWINFYKSSCASYSSIHFSLFLQRNNFLFHL